jgi:hypothetical protein
LQQLIFESFVRFPSRDKTLMSKATTSSDLLLVVCILIFLWILCCACAAIRFYCKRKDEIDREVGDSIKGATMAARGAVFSVEERPRRQNSLEQMVQLGHSMAEDLRKHNERAKQKQSRTKSLSSQKSQNAPELDGVDEYKPRRKSSKEILVGVAHSLKRAMQKQTSIGSLPSEESRKDKKQGMQKHTSTGSLSSEGSRRGSVTVQAPKKEDLRKSATSRSYEAPPSVLSMYSMTQQRPVQQQATIYGRSERGSLPGVVHHSGNVPQIPALIHSIRRTEILK